MKKNWHVVRYEWEGKALYAVIEYEGGDRERIAVRDSKGNMLW